MYDQVADFPGKEEKSLLEKILMNNVGLRDLRFMFDIGVLELERDISRTFALRWRVF